MNRRILITGATAGIGESTARMFAAEGDHLLLTGRREERLETLKKELESEHQVDILVRCFDIRDRDEVRQIMDSLPREWQSIDILINNAGLAAGLDRVQDASLEDWDTMVDTNIKGLLYISSIVIPWMVARRQGHIVNIGSIAGKEVYPKGSVYCATKHAVDALSKGMRMDLVDKGIRVTQVSPGAVETEFSMVRFKGDEERAMKVYQGYQPLAPGDIAEIIRYVTGLPAHVNINDILVMPTAQASSTVFDRE